MFIKLVILLLLVIVAASLLAGRGSGRGRKPGLRPLMLRAALVLLALSGIVAAIHLSA